MPAEAGGSGSSSSSTAHQDSTSSRDALNGAAIDVGQLQSSDRAALLTAVDRLRREHIGEHIEDGISIPQIVVCGSQSSGKSSVLEAITGVPFPAGVGRTTRFATEVILRHSDRAKISVKLIAAGDRDNQTKEKIKAFQRSHEAFQPTDLDRLVKEAQGYLEEIEPITHFWKDWLSLEISGPRQPHLTLIDLPGIIQFESGESAAPGDKEKIMEMVLRYVKRPKTIVLAVLDATHDLEHHDILNIAERTAEGRSLGVITKPDLLPNPRDAKENTVRLAKNQRVALQPLGWHILRNLDHATTERNATHRDEVERQFFAQEPWSQLSPSITGVASLRTKLAEQLFKSILEDLPQLRTQMRGAQKQCVDDLKRLGSTRRTIAQQKSYFQDVLKRLSSLIEDAVKGNYEEDETESFFDTASSEFVSEKNLRDRIRIETESFASEMRRYGKQYNIHVSSEIRADRPRNTRLVDLAQDEKPKFSAPFTTPSSGPDENGCHTRNVSLKVYCKALSRYMRANRGTDLPGMSFKKPVRATFRQLSVPWTDIVETFEKRCCDIVQSFLQLAIRSVADEHTAEALLQEYVYPSATGFGRRRLKLGRNIEKLLWPYKECHPITYHPAFNPRAALESYTDASRPEKTWGDIARESEFDNHLLDAADVLDQTESYYDIALNTFIENVASLGIEKCLLHRLSDLIPLSEVTDLDDGKIAELTAEPPELVERRATLEAKKAALDEFIRVCDSYLNRRPAPVRVPPPTIEDLAADDIDDHVGTSEDAPQNSNSRATPKSIDSSLGSRGAQSLPNPTSTANPFFNFPTQTSQVQPTGAANLVFPDTGHGGTLRDDPSPVPATSKAFGKSRAITDDSSKSNASSRLETPPPARTAQSTDSLGEHKPTSSGSIFANFGGSTDSRPVDFRAPTSGPGMFSAQTNATTGSGGFKPTAPSTSSATGAGPSLFANTGSGGFKPTPPSTSSATGAGPSLFGSANFSGRSVTPAATGGSLYGGSAINQVDRPRSTGSNMFGGGPKYEDTNAEGNASGKSNLYPYYTPTKGTGWWIFKALARDEKHSDDISTCLYQSVTMHKPFKSSSFEELRVDDYYDGRKHGDNQLDTVQ